VAPVVPVRQAPLDKQFWGNMHPTHLYRSGKSTKEETFHCTNSKQNALKTMV